MTDSGDSGPQIKSVRLGLIAVTALAATAIWIATMAQYATNSDDPHEANGNPVLFPLLALLSAVVGYLEPKHPKVVGSAVIAGPLLLSPWTTPRGDGDGLWGLMIPLLAAFWFALVWCARMGGSARDSS